MARLPRSALPPAGVYHVTSRGVDGCAIVLDDDDRLAFVRRLTEVCRRFVWRCHVFCLMDTHYHVLVETTVGALSAGCHRLNGLHAQAFNERHRRTGHLFGDRFHARVVRDDLHLAAAVLYIRDNPVRAGACDDARDWRWSGSLYSSRIATARTGEPYAGSTRSGKP
jgi:REP element-mobilizing transposase RayT